MRATLVFVLVLTVCACSKSPTSPSNFAQVGGGWTGTFTSSNWNPLVVDLVLTQAGGDVTGTWAILSADWNGTISASVSKTTFTGTFTISAPNASGVGPRCTGNASVSGPASTGANTMTLSSPGFTGSCTGLPLSVTLTLQRK